MAACHELADVGRAARWVAATADWLATLPSAVLFAGICRAHRSQVLEITGEWDRAEAEAARVCTDLTGISTSAAAEGHYQVGQLRRLRGDLVAAAEAYRPAHGLHAAGRARRLPHRAGCAEPRAGRPDRHPARGHVAGVARAFRVGGGVPYEAYRPEFTAVMDGLSRGLLDGQLVDGIVPLVPGLPKRLAAGARVADVGCGTGHAVNLLARASPRSTVVGYDIAADAIDMARAEAAAWG